MLAWPMIPVKQAERLVFLVFLPIAIAGITTLVFVRPVSIPIWNFYPVLKFADR
jgi:hypothetical protein